MKDDDSSEFDSGCIDWIQMWSWVDTWPESPFQPEFKLLERSTNPNLVSAKTELYDVKSSRAILFSPNIKPRHCENDTFKYSILRKIYRSVHLEPSAGMLWLQKSRNSFLNFQVFYYELTFHCIVYLKWRLSKNCTTSAVADWSACPGPIFGLEYRLLKTVVVCKIHANKKTSFPPN